MIQELAKTGMFVLVAVHVIYIARDVLQGHLD